MRQLVVVTGALCVAMGATSPAAAQYQPPQCELNTGHFLVNGAVVYLKGAAEEEDAQKAQQMLTDARRNLVEAVSRGEEGNPAVWYFLGRYYKEVGDAAGTDSAFTRAAELAPACQEDIDYHRQVMWVPTVNEGIDALRNGDFDTAKQRFTSATHLWRQDPIAHYYLARIYGNEGEVDSALTYFKRTIEIGAADTARAEAVQDSHKSIGILYMMRAQQGDASTVWDSATSWLQSYVDEYPGDGDALMTLAQAYDESGKREQAMALYDRILGQAASMDALSLFAIGTTFFRAQNFEAAARAYEAGLQHNPYHRDALFNLANTYQVLEDAPKMLDAARRLEQLDPQNQETARLMSGAHQLAGHGDSTLTWLQRTRRMQFEVLVDFFEQMQSSFGVSGRIRNTTNRAVQVPTVTFEFLNAEGHTVATDSVAGGSLPAGSDQGFELTAADTTIVAWRYKVGS